MESIFLIHWNEEEAKKLAEYMLMEDVEIHIEYRNRARAIERIWDINPSVILIYLSRDPPEGRKTADSLIRFKELHHIPIIFVDGKEKDVEKMRKKIPDAVYTTSGQLDKTLKMFMRL
jgi:hypothetical protein